MSNPITRRRMLLTAGAAALAAPSCTARADHARPVATVIWREDFDGFGGFSGIELRPDRQTFVAVSDRGYLVHGRLARDADGRLSGVSLVDRHPLTDRDGAPLSTRASDAEGLALLPDGTLLVAFEGGRHSRIDRYDGNGRPRGSLERHDDWQRVPTNLALESVAVDAAGVPYALLESAGDAGFALYRYGAGGAWSVIGHLPAQDDFVPVGADFGPDGNLYVLQRRFRVAFFANRILRLRPGAWSRPELLVETSYGVLDNHEGISVTADEDGQLWATTISDDNLSRFQRTEIAEFLLP